MAFNTDFNEDFLTEFYRFLITLMPRTRSIILEESTLSIMLEEIRGEIILEEVE